MSKWISVKDRLPPKEVNVLCYCMPGLGSARAYIETSGAQGFPFGDYSDITHWMPLPNPPTDTEV